MVRDNIMYSAYVQSMALLYHYLFDDDRYAKPGALTFSYWSFFWGGAERRGLLRHADRYMAPTWRDSGFCFPRNDTPENAEGLRTLVER